MTDTERIATALERIATVLDMLITTPAPEPTCEHPEGARIEFRTMGQPIRWVCSLDKGGCGYRYGFGDKT